MLELWPHAVGPSVTPNMSCRTVRWLPAGVASHPYTAAMRRSGSGRVERDAWHNLRIAGSVGGTSVKMGVLPMRTRKLLIRLSANSGNKGDVCHSCRVCNSSVRTKYRSWIFKTAKASIGHEAHSAVQRAIAISAACSKMAVWLSLNVGGNEMKTAVGGVTGLGRSADACNVEAFRRALRHTYALGMFAGK